VSGGTAGNSKSATEFVTGGYAPTFAGITGEKSLGDGFTGGFKLEQGFLLNPSSGNVGFFSDLTGIFNREANLYIKSNAGTLTLGTQGNAFFSSLLSVDPRNAPNFGSSLGATKIDGGMGTNDKGGVSYESPSMSGLSFKVGYMPSNYSENIKTGTRFSLKYANGPLMVTAASYNTDVKATAPATNDYRNTGTLAGGSYKVGDATLKLMSVKQTNPTYKDLQTLGYGGAYQLTSKLAIDFGIYDSKDGATGYKTNTIGTGIQYKFLKDLTAYGQYSTVKNTGTQTAAYNFAPPMAADDGKLLANQTGNTLNIGLLYGFF
jgi:predicted porin